MGYADRDHPRQRYKYREGEKQPAEEGLVADYHQREEGDGVQGVAEGKQKKAISLTETHLAS